MPVFGWLFRLRARELQPSGNRRLVVSAARTEAKEGGESTLALRLAAIVAVTIAGWAYAIGW